MILVAVHILEQYCTGIQNTFQILYCLLYLAVAQAVHTTVPGTYQVYTTYTVHDNSPEVSHRTHHILMVTAGTVGLLPPGCKACKQTTCASRRSLEALNWKI